MPLVSTPPPVRKAAPAAPKQSKANKDRAEALEGLGALAQVPLIALRQYADAGAVGLYWPGVARELANLADTQEQIANLVDPLLKVGPYAALVTAVVPVILQIGVNHKIMPPGAMGTVPASLLSAQVETSLAQAELDALRLQAETERAAQAIRDEIALARIEHATEETRA